jgi:hypothetical protein
MAPVTWLLVVVVRNGEGGGGVSVWVPCVDANGAHDGKRRLAQPAAQNFANSQDDVKDRVDERVEAAEQRRDRHGRVQVTCMCFCARMRE